jgi:phosphatidylglycerophosphate synthase
MRKIPFELENPIDNLIYLLVENTTDQFYKLGFTPNALTTISLIFSVLSIKSITSSNKNYKLSALYFGISYIFDCYDGYLARKYNMISKFGDYYDHFSDIFKIIYLFIVLLKINKNKFQNMLPYYILLGFLCCIHIGCQEKYYNKKTDTSSYLTIDICKDKEDAINKMRYTRFFGCGTITLFLICVILWYQY